MDITKTTIGRKAEVTDESIVQAGQKLSEEGRRVTGFALRKVVGNRGDAKRLLKVWLAFMSSQTMAPDSNAPLALPVELEETLNSVVNETTAKLKSLAIELNNAAVNTAEQRVAAAVALANEREQAAEAEVCDAALTLDDLEQQLTSISLEYAQCQQALQQSKQETQSQIQQAGEFNIEISTIAEQLTTLGRANENLINSAETMQQTIDKLTVEMIEIKADKNEIKTENKQLIDEITRLSNGRDKQLFDLIEKLDPFNDAAV